LSSSVSAFYSQYLQSKTKKVYDKQEVRRLKNNIQPMPTKTLQIRNSTAEFLIFTKQAGENGIEVHVQDGTIWLSQKLIATLFDCSIDNISLHLKNIFTEGELDEFSVTEDFSVTAADGKNYRTKHYNLDAIIAVGYRINTRRATAFRQWATTVLRDYALRGYVIDRKRMENGFFLDKDYFEHLLEEIREIRLSERRFYQKITDIYSTAMDYNKNAPITKEFFAKVQNKLHYAIHGHTAAEVIYERADSAKDHMGLTTWENSPRRRAFKEGETKRLDRFLEADDRAILQDGGKISAQVAKEFAESEFEKYRIIQDRLFESDFDKEIKKIEAKKQKS
jgi:hypothetical protein